jgi:hypothetical protein
MVLAPRGGLWIRYVKHGVKRMQDAKVAEGISATA